MKRALIPNPNHIMNLIKKNTQHVKDHIITIERKTY